MKPSKDKRSEFDEDLHFGEEGERWLLWFADEAKVEVKRERDCWHKSGNIFFEFQCKGKPSGLAVTKADWWLHILTLEGEQKGILAFPVPALKKRLRSLLSEGRVETISTGGETPSRGVLFPMTLLSELIENE